MEKKSVCIIGSGNWATAVAKIVAENVDKLQDFENRVNMFVYEEDYEEKQLSALINTLHVNKKYAPDIKLPQNVVGITDLIETARYADVIIFVAPHSRIIDFCKTLLGKIKPDALAITLTNGFEPNEVGDLQLPSHAVLKYLKALKSLLNNLKQEIFQAIPCSVLVGASLATPISMEDYCEATLGCRDFKNSKVFADIFNSENFRVNVVDDADCVEVCGFLKFVLAYGAGLLDGFDCSANIKSTFIRFGFLEMIRFVDVFYPGSKMSTFFESCGLADLITACTASRNRRVGETFVKSQLSLEELELKILGGDKLMGPIIATSVSFMLKHKGLESKFPLFMTIHKICQNDLRPEEILNCIRKMPDIIYHPTNIFPL